MAEDQERNSVGGRWRRYARVSTAMGGLAARVAGERYLGMKVDRERHAADLKAALGGLKGPLMKVAQILSTLPDALPAEYAAQFTELQANAPHMGWPFVRRRMAGELGADWESRFTDFSREAVAAASLGQVHRATLAGDGRAVACKLQYPDMASIVQADIRQLKIIMSIYRQYDSSIDTSEIHAELAERLQEELDYRREARHMALYGHMLRDEPAVTVPEPVPALTTHRLLTMTWQQGTSMHRFLADNDDQDARNQVAANMFRAWYVPFYYYGVIHGDPHLGNYTVTDDNGINLLDFGCIRVFPPAFVQGVIDLYRALAEGDEALAVSAYERWGFVDLSRDAINTLNRWASFVYAPLMEDRPRLIQETNTGVYGREVAQQVHAELRALGTIRPPREFVLMDRAAVGLGSVFLRLGARMNWYRLFHDMIAQFDVTALAARQQEALRRVGLVVEESGRDRVRPAEDSPA